MGKETLEHSKTVADTEPAKSKPDRNQESSDKLGTLAKTESAPSSLQRSIRVIENSYTWFAGAATQRLDAKFRRDLKEEDEPDWISTIASGLLEMAIGAGAAGAGAHLAKKVATKLGPNTGEGLTEFVKVMFEGGVNAGITAGRSKLGAGKDGNVIDPFVDAQIEGVHKAAMASQTAFTETGQDSIHTGADAAAIKEAFSPAHLEDCAERQYEVSRDSWVSYLAQSKFGAIGSKGGAVKPDSHDVGATTTNMSDRERRKQTNKHAPGFVPEEAPGFGKAMQGKADGVLAVAVRLPTILAGVQMTGRPTVEHAFLNGVNGTIREQYENQPFGSLHIPRQLIVAIEGETQKFELGVNEKGELGGVPRSGGLHDWLVARSTVAHPENVSKSDFGKVFEGTRLLLDELVATSIRK